MNKVKKTLYNIDKIKGKMAEHKENRSNLALYLGISLAGLNKKLSGKTLFNANELYLIANRFSIDLNFFYPQGQQNIDKKGE